MLLEVRQGGVVAGSAGEIQEHLPGPEEAGLQRSILQWLDLEDLKSLERLARTIL